MDIRGKITALLALAAAGLAAAVLSTPQYAEASTTAALPIILPPSPPAIPEPELVPPRPVLPVRIVRMRVTACSPQDPQDVAYYAKRGYEGGVYGIAAYTRDYPRGTLMRVPGYMERSFPDKFWEVDSAGGSVIRRSARRGIDHIDVKFRTLHSARQWGSRWLDVEVILPADYEAWKVAVAEWDAQHGRDNAAQ